MATPVPDSPTLDRRAFCGACALGLGALACGGGGGASPMPAPPPPNPVVPTGQTKAGLTPNTPLGFNLGSGCAGSGFYLVKDSGGVYALKAICTHLGGQPMIDSGTAGGTVFKCPCHGSEYDLNGAVTLGPAPRTLDHLLVAEATPGGVLTVDTSQVVSSTLRL